MSENFNIKINILKEIFSNLGKRPIIVCVGNDLRNDDGIGPYIARNIKNDKFKIIDAGQIFENYIYEIIDYNPTDVVFIDAAFFGSSPGDLSLIDENNISSFKLLSTHSLPLTHLLDLIRFEIKDVKIHIIGIQVANIDFGENISSDVKKTGDDIINYINSL